MDANVISMERDKVIVDTPVGCFSGIWRSTKVAHLKRYILELDCDEVLNSQNIAVVKENSFSIKELHDKIYLIGHVEKIEDGMLFLSLHTDIIMFETEDSLEIEQFAHQTVCITLSHINLFDVEAL